MDNSKGTKTPVNDRNSTATGPKRRRRKDRGARARTRALEDARDMIQARAPAIAARALELGLRDSKPSTAILLGLLRCIASPAKEGTTAMSTFKLDTPRDAAHCQELLAEIASAVASGRLDTDSARVSTQALTAWLNARSQVEIDARLADVERTIAARPQSHLRPVR